MSTLSTTNRFRQKVLGYPVDTASQAQVLGIIESAWQAGKGLQIITLNAEMVVAAQQDPVLDRIIRHAHLIIPDGAGVVWALRLSGHYVNRLPGIELAYAALDLAALQNRSVALIGGRKEVVAKLQKELPIQHPGLKIVSAHHGYFSLDEEKHIVSTITKQEPELVLVALGMPKQEYFIEHWFSQFGKAIMIGVGGSFDVWAGQTKRAPRLLRKLCLEWLHRLCTEPRRWQRISTALPKFGIQVLKDFFRKQ